jgi:hypothetical protein
LTVGYINANARIDVLMMAIEFVDVVVQVELVLTLRFRLLPVEHLLAIPQRKANGTSRP